LALLGQFYLPHAPHSLATRELSRQEVAKSSVLHSWGKARSCDDQPTMAFFLNEVLFFMRASPALIPVLQSYHQGKPLSTLEILDRTLVIFRRFLGVKSA
jgi:hypothetical protein